MPIADDPKDQKKLFTPEVSPMGTLLSLEYIETYRKALYKEFLHQRRVVYDDLRFHSEKEDNGEEGLAKYITLLGSLEKGQTGYEILTHHGMPEENIQELADMASADEFDHIRIDWRPKLDLDDDKIDEIIAEASSVLPSLVRLSTEEEEDPDIADNLHHPVYDEGWTDKQEGAVGILYFIKGLRTEIVTTDDSNNSGDTKKSLKMELIEEDSRAALEGLKAGDLTQGQGELHLFYDAVELFEGLADTEEVFEEGEGKHAMYVDIKKFRAIQIDKFYTIYLPAVHIDMQKHKNFWEKLIEGILRVVGWVVNAIVDILLAIPLVSSSVEWILDGIADIFGVSHQKSKGILGAIIVTVVVTVFTWGTGTTTTWGLMTAASNAYSGVQFMTAASEFDLKERGDWDSEKTLEELDVEEHKREQETLEFEYEEAMGLDAPNYERNQPMAESQPRDGYANYHNIYQLDI